MNTSAKKKSEIGIAILGVGVFACYAMGTFFPDLWWTTHWLAFLSPFWRYSLLLSLLALSLSPLYWPRDTALLSRSTHFSSHYSNILLFVLISLVGLLMYHFPIYQDFYGDAYKVLDRLGETVKMIPSGTNEALTKLSLSPWDGHTTILALVTYLAYYTGLSYGEAFVCFDLVFGVLFVGMWLFYVKRSQVDVAWQIVMGIAGVTAPFLLIYFGHIESYAAVFCVFMGWMMMALKYIKTQKPLLLYGLIPLLLLCLKLHPIALLFVPSLGILFIAHYAKSSLLGQSLMHWRGIFRWVLLPIFAAGLVLYFFVFEDYKDPRDLNFNVQAFDRLFLPLLTPEAPLDRYNLLSFNHIFDFFSEMFLWSPMVLLVLAYAFTWGRKQVDWNALPIRFVGLNLLLLVSLLFMINPLLSMQLDWDLLAIPAPVFLLFGLVVVEHGDFALLAKRFVPIAFGLGIMFVPIIWVHSDQSMHSKRLEAAGVRMYHTYYEWSSKTLTHALNMDHYASRQAYEKRKAKLIKKLKPAAQANVDFEYARLLIEEGQYYLRRENLPSRALTYLQKAEYYFPMEKNGLLYSLEAHFRLGNYEQAFLYSEKLIEIRYPSEAKSIAIAVQCALEAEFYEEALNLSNYYLEKWNDSQAITETNRRLKLGEEIESLKLLFARAPEKK